MSVSSSLSPRDYIRVGFFIALGALLLGLAAFTAYRFLDATLAVITPFVIGLLLALLLDPLADKLVKYGMSRMAAVGAVFGVFLLIIVGIGWLVIPALMAQASNFAQNGPSYVRELQVYTDRFLAAHPKIGPFHLPSSFQTMTAQLSDRASTYAQVAGGQVTGILLGSATVLIQCVLTLIILFYLLVDIDRLRARLFFLAPEKWRGQISQVGGDIGGVFSDYLRGLLIVCALYGVFTIGMLYVLSIFHHSVAQYALLVGAAAGILYAVPYLGAFTTALLTFVVSFWAASVDQQSGFAFGGIALAATLALNQVFDNVVTPRVVGGGVGLHPVLALFALVIGGELFQLPGMLLSVPIAGSVQVILFRLYPRLTQPTPDPFLRTQGVPAEKKPPSPQ